MTNWFHKHKFHVVAYDHGYHTSYTDTDTKTYHHATFSKCDCGARKFDIEKSTGYSGTNTHGGLMRAKHAWLEKNELRITDKSDVYDDNYTLIDSSRSMYIYAYQPVTGVEKILNLLKNNDEFGELRKHQMIDDAFVQLETVIKMHENLEVPK